MGQPFRVAFPEQQHRRLSKRVEKLLLLCYYDPENVSTVPETVAYIQRESQFSITVLNLFEHRHVSGALRLPAALDLGNFCGVIVHNSISYNVDNLRLLEQGREETLRGYRGVKVLMKQDENYRLRELAQYVGETGYDIVFTCLPDSDIEKVYPREIVGSPKFVRMLTGYVTPTLRALTIGDGPRKIDIGYRGSIQPLSFGRLAYEKRKIGEDIKRLLGQSGLTLDISSRWEDRIGGKGWFDFLASCKATLGVESGASIFDLNGDIEARCKELERLLGPFREDEEYAESYLNGLAEYEGNVYYNQISPRHFEAAATRTLQVMYPGAYSDIFVPSKHFVELQRDYSNLDEVVATVLDDDLRSEIVERAYEEIIQSPKYWIETFVAEFDAAVEEALAQKEGVRATVFVGQPAKTNVLLLAAHPPRLDPRLDWIARCAPGDIQVALVGVWSAGGENARHIALEGGRYVSTEPWGRLDWDTLLKWFVMVAADDAGQAAIAELQFMLAAVGLEDHQFAELFNAPLGGERARAFRWYLNYILGTTAALVSAAERARNFDVVVATDLDTLAAALVVKGMFNVPVLYDAHEYWPEADVASLEFESQYWGQLESRLVKHVDARQTVSPGLAALMADQYGCDFGVVPNCEPLSFHQALRPRPVEAEAGCRFIYQGTFAPHRGLDLLIQAWPLTTEEAVLLLRGPDNDYKHWLISEAKRTGLLGKRILFPKPVSEHELVAAAGEGDVGVIPYTPMRSNYAHCCPNKMSQYMAAGLPILANRTSYVEHIVCQSGAGIALDFSIPDNIASAVNHLVRNPKERKQMGERSRRYFASQFNWETMGRSMYDSLAMLAANEDPKPFLVFGEGSRGGMYLRQAESLQPIHALAATTWPIARSFWRLLPAQFRYRFGPSLQRTVKKISARTI